MKNVSTRLRTVGSTVHALAVVPWMVSGRPESSALGVTEVLLVPGGLVAQVVVDSSQIAGPLVLVVPSKPMSMPQKRVACWAGHLTPTTVRVVLLVDSAAPMLPKGTP